MKRLRPIRRGSGMRRPTSPVVRRRASTSSSCATGSRPSRGTRPPPVPPCPRTSSQGTRARYIEAYERITGASFERYLAGGRHRPMTSHRFAVNVTPKPGILDPQGRAVEGSLGHLGIEGVSGVRVGRRVELTVDARRRGRGAGRRRAAGLRAAVEPAHRGLRDRGHRSGHVVARRRLEATRADGRSHRRRRLPGQQLRPRHRARPRAGRRRAGRPVARAGDASRASRR